MLFEEFGLKPELLRSIKEMGFVEPTPIQASAIPIALRGRDVIGQAKTGTGKTVAFSIPLISSLSHNRSETQALVLVPTRELAVQVCDEIGKIGRFSGVSLLPVYGGTSIGNQINALRRGIQVVVGTPGRILDHLRQGTLKLDKIKFLVLDEADRMLDMGFIDDIKLILSKIPQNRQTLLFSATMPGPIADIAVRFMRNPEKIRVSSDDQLTVKEVKQFYYEINNYKDKLQALIAILHEKKPVKTIVFCRTKREADFVGRKLYSERFRAMAIHGDLSQSKRDYVMQQFKGGKIDILVATDVAARGLDIDNVSHVINYTIPMEPTAYVHRIGRTARAGESGDAITFVGPQEWLDFKKIKQLAGEILLAKLPESFKPTPVEQSPAHFGGQRHAMRGGRQGFGHQQHRNRSQHAPQPHSGERKRAVFRRF